MDTFNLAYNMVLQEETQREITGVIFINVISSTNNKSRINLNL